MRDPRPPNVSPDLADAVAEVVHLCFGAVSLAQGVALGTSKGRSTAGRPGRARVPAVDLTDLVVGSAWEAAQLSGRLATAGSRVVVPIVGLVLRPPLVPQGLQPAEGARRIVERWRRDRPETVRSLGSWSSTAVPVAVDAALSQLDVQRLVRIVLDHIDLNVLAADVVRRLDIDTLSSAVMSRADLDSLLASALARVDLAPAVSSALDRLDLTQIVLDRIDLIAVAEYVVDGIDLPEIIRDSTGSVASEAVQVMRLRAVDGDAAVARAIDRVLRRHRHHKLEAAQDDTPLDE